MYLSLLGTNFYFSSIYSVGPSRQFHFEEKISMLCIRRGPRFCSLAHGLMTSLSANQWLSFGLASCTANDQKLG